MFSCEPLLNDCIHRYAVVFQHSENQIILKALVHSFHEVFKSQNIQQKFAYTDARKVGDDKPPIYLFTAVLCRFRQSDIDSGILTQLIFLAGSTDVSTEDISDLLSQSNSTVSVYTYSLLGESNNSSELKTRSVNRLQEMARTSNGKFEVK